MAKVITDVLLKDGTDETTFVNDVTSNDEVELNNMGGPLSEDELVSMGPVTEEIQGLFNQLGNQIITSLLIPHGDITIEKATARKGKRYGFYQQDIK